MSEAVLITIIGIISSTISAIISWVLTRRKYNVGVKSDELTNLKATMEIYQSTINSLKIEVDRNSKQAEEADKKAEEAKLEVYRLRAIIHKILGEACLNDKCLKRKFYTEKQIKDMLSEIMLSTPKEDDIIPLEQSIDEEAQNVKQ